MSKIKKFKDFDWKGFFFPVVKAIETIDDQSSSTRIDMDELDNDYEEVKDILKDRKESGKDQHKPIFLKKRNK